MHIIVSLFYAYIYMGTICAWYMFDNYIYNIEMYNMYIYISWCPIYIYIYTCINLTIYVPICTYIVIYIYT